MRIKATDLNGAVINGVVQTKTTDGDYEVDMKQENGGMVSESILLVSDGDDDVTFNGKGTDNGKNDQTLLADFGSKIIVTFPELGTGETTFQAQQPIAKVTLDIAYCYPLATGAPAQTVIPAEMVRLMTLQSRKMQEIYRQIGYKVEGVTPSRLVDFPAGMLAANGPEDPQGNLNSGETQGLLLRLKLSPASTKIRVGFVDAGLTDKLGYIASGLVDVIGEDPVLVSLAGADGSKLNLLAHEAGHAIGHIHRETYAPNKDHWLMRVAGGSKWSFDSLAAKRWHQSDASDMQTASSYVTAP